MAMVKSISGEDIGTLMLENHRNYKYRQWLQLYLLANEEDREELTEGLLPEPEDPQRRKKVEDLILTFRSLLSPQLNNELSTKDCPFRRVSPCDLIKNAISFLERYEREEFGG